MCEEVHQALLLFSRCQLRDGLSEVYDARFLSHSSYKPYCCLVKGFDGTYDSDGITVDSVWKHHCSVLESESRENRCGRSPSKKCGNDLQCSGASFPLQFPDRGDIAMCQV